jgi:predicted amidohydrolase YtcJ
VSDTNGTADLVFVNGPVYTVDASRRWAGAVAVRSGTIVAVGTDDDVRAWTGAHTEVVDLAGRMVLPGFQDAHIHPPGSGLEMLRCNLSEIYSLEE